MVIPKGRGRRSHSILVAATALLGVLVIAPSASASCGMIIVDPPPPGFHNFFCSHGAGAVESWTVPDKITRPEFILRGADDAVGGAGGLVHVKMPVTAGETLEIHRGVNGAATSITKSGGEALLVAGGGNGDEGNYVDPSAEVIETEAPGGPGGKWPLDGSVYVGWYDRRDFVSAPQPKVVADIFDSQKIVFSHAGWWEWTAPAGLERVFVELWGGSGESGEPHGHVLAGYNVKPGERLGFITGGIGEDTSAYRLTPGWPELLAMAAGGDTERPNYVFLPATRGESFWEGGGIGSQPSEGRVRLHFWLRQQEEQLPKDRPPLQPSACVVPRLKGKTPRAARRSLTRAKCRLGARTRAPSRRRMRGRIIGQSPSPGKVLPAETAVAVVVGRRP